jgi:phosphatidylserine/phosphatidylglycerophosphate/cardiolipin synthase-like enzyme
MIVDDKVYVGSMNIAARYTTRKYGSRAFRDLSAIAYNTEAKQGAKDFFLNSMRENAQFNPLFNLSKAEEVFKDINERYKRID